MAQLPGGNQPPKVLNNPKLQTIGSFFKAASATQKAKHNARDQQQAVLQMDKDKAAQEARQQAAAANKISVGPRSRSVRESTIPHHAPQSVPQ
jgi:hypothetical protein